MFDNIGGKLKTLAVILFIIGVVASLVCAIAFGITVDRWGDADFNFWLFLLILVAGCIGSYIGVLMLYAFGQLVENSDIRTQLAIKADMESEHKKKENKETASYQYSSSAQKTAAETPQKDCPYCGARNHIHNKTCFACGKTIK